jgi:hypothetical protein
MNKSLNIYFEKACSPLSRRPPLSQFYHTEALCDRAHEKVKNLLRGCSVQSRISEKQTHLTEELILWQAMVERKWFL